MILLQVEASKAGKVRRGLQFNV